MTLLGQVSLGKCFYLQSSTFNRPRSAFQGPLIYSECGLQRLENVDQTYIVLARGKVAIKSLPIKVVRLNSNSNQVPVIHEEFLEIWSALDSVRLTIKK